MVVLNEEAGSDGAPMRMQSGHSKEILKRESRAKQSKLALVCSRSPSFLEEEGQGPTRWISTAPSGSPLLVLGLSPDQPPGPRSGHLGARFGCRLAGHAPPALSPAGFLLLVMSHRDGAILHNRYTGRSAAGTADAASLSARLTMRQVHEAASRVLHHLAMGQAAGGVDGMGAGGGAALTPADDERDPASLDARQSDYLNHLLLGKTGPLPLLLEDEHSRAGLEFVFPRLVPQDLQLVLETAQRQREDRAHASGVAGRHQMPRATRAPPTMHSLPAGAPRQGGPSPMGLSLRHQSRSAAYAGPRRSPPTPARSSRLSSPPLAPLQTEAYPPPTEEGRLYGSDFEMSKCRLGPVYLSERPGGVRVRQYILQSHASQRVWKFLRQLRKAIYGEVWEALEITIEGQTYDVCFDEDGRPMRYAMKVMPWTKINSLSQVCAENPLREMAALDALSSPGHPNVLTSVEILTEGKYLFLVTPFIEGGEMYHWIMREYPIDEREFRPLFKQIVEGMKYMHNKNICHHDLSPENTLMDRAAERAFIIDFGMSLAMPQDEFGRRLLSVRDDRFAKSSYRCPEVQEGQDYDGVKVDVFAAGVILFFALTGSRPFRRATLGDRHYRMFVESGVTRLLTQMRLPPVTQEAADLLMSMMAYHSRDRPMPEEILQHAWLRDA